MNKKVNVFLGLAIAVMAMVAVFVLFAPTFYDAIYDDTHGGSEFGSVFQTMFYGWNSKVDSKSAVIPLIIGFGLECLGFILGFVCCFGNGKKSVVPFIITTLVMAAAGAIFLLSKTFYLSANPSEAWEARLSLGAGSICSIVFAWLGALLAAYGAYTNLKA